MPDSLLCKVHILCVTYYYGHTVTDVCNVLSAIVKVIQSDFTTGIHHFVYKEVQRHQHFILICCLVMGKKADLSESKVAAIKALLDAGNMTYREIAAQMGVSRGSITNIKRRFQNKVTGSSRIGKCGRKRKTSQATDRLMVRSIRHEPLLTAAQVNVRVGANVSTRTVRRRLNEHGCRSVRPRKVQKLTAAMMKKRMQWAKYHAH